MLKLLSRRNKAGAGAAAGSLDSTSFSLSTAVPRPSEEQADARGQEMMPVGRLIGSEGQALCRIRSMSAGGLVAETNASVAVGAMVRVELSSVQRLGGRVVWTRGETIGIKFDQDADVRALARPQSLRETLPPRPPRLEIRCGASIRIGRHFHQAEVRDISLGGIKLALTDPGPAGQEAIVTIDSLRAIKGRLCWYRDGLAGIVFDTPLCFDELAEWLGKRVEVASLRAGAWEGR
jgi:hypothetical protein